MAINYTGGAPLLADIIQELNPNAAFIVTDENIDTIQWVDGTPEIDKATILAKKAECARNRKQAYNDITMREQLDKLWHDIDSGKLGADAKTGGWYTAIKAVKDKYPKSQKSLNPDNLTGLV